MCQIQYNKHEYIIEFITCLNNFTGVAFSIVDVLRELYI